MPSRNFTDAQEIDIARRYLSGESARAIGRSFGLHHISICAALRRQGVEQRSAPERNRRYKVNPHVFDIIDNEVAAYWLGFIYADGVVFKRTFRVALAQRDKNHLVYLRDFMESTSPIKEVVQRTSYNAIVEFTDRHLAQRLIELGIVPSRPFPERMIDNVPPPFVHHCIRGFFDGDGSARKNKSISICGDTTILSWIRQSVAFAAGTNPNLALTKHIKSDIYYLTYSGRRQALKFTDFIYNDATIWLKRKRDVVNSWPTSPSYIRPTFPNGYNHHKN